MGYVYALQFDDLSIKVGQAGDADKRIARHKAEAARFGHRVIQVWSAKVPRPSATEGRLIDYCLSHGTARPGTREYFTGVPWDSEVWDKVSARTPPAWDSGTGCPWDTSHETAGQVVPGTAVPRTRTRSSGTRSAPAGTSATRYERSTRPRRSASADRNYGHKR